MSTAALQESKYNFVALNFIIATPLVLGFVAVMALAFNDSFALQGIATKSITIIAVCGGAVGAVLVGLTVWSLVYHRFTSAVMVWAVFAVCAVGVWLLLNFFYFIVGVLV